jgi:acetyl esterase/lipase
VTYHVASGVENKLDVYAPKNADGPVPVILLIHGGGWVGGLKETYVMRLLPYLEMGWAVVNVEYRMASVALAPAAVEDCLCSLRWIARNAEQYNLDASRVVVTGMSAGGHLSLTTGMIPSSAGLDRQCEERAFSGPRAPDPANVAAIINWYGITDVVDLLAGPNTKGYAVEWLGSLVNREEVAARVSPLTYVSRDVPPILTIHGDADPIVPYQHALRLQEKLNAASVPNELHTVPGGGHGRFNDKQTIEIYSKIFSFLSRHGVSGKGSTSQ